MLNRRRNTVSLETNFLSVWENRSFTLNYFSLCFSFLRLTSLETSEWQFALGQHKNYLEALQRPYASSNYVSLSFHRKARQTFVFIWAPLIRFHTKLFITRRDLLQPSDFGNTLVMISLSENGLNPGIAHLYWKLSSGLLESWEGLLLATDVSTTCAEAIIRLDSVKTMLKLPLFDLQFILLFFFFQLPCRGQNQHSMITVTLSRMMKTSRWA